ncbi:MAG: peptidylprolyl isomerase [Planctomycetaceae bacterium]|nr:peptidylprolyl isomerase [Planctomycetaceae bacterium]
MDALKAILVVCGILWSCGGDQLGCAEAAETLAKVNSELITSKDLEQLVLLSGDNLQAESRSQLLTRAIENCLIRQFLESRGVAAPVELVDRQMGLVEKILAQEGDAEATLNRLNVTRKDLRAQVSLPLAWSRYVRQVVTADQLREYYESHQKELDGTRREASQIFMKLPAGSSDEQVRQVQEKLSQIRQEVLSGTLSFAEAAKKYSESPTAARGGELGEFTFTGQMPAEITRMTFSTSVGELSQPFQSPYGMHLVQVTKETPGQLSLEDARPQIWKHFEDQLWSQTVSRLQSSGQIQRFD